MARSSKDIYRGKRRWRVPVTLVVTILLVLIIAAVVLFYSLQKYAVYDKDGVTLAIPGLTTAAPADNGEPDASAPLPQVSAELVVAEPDYSQIDLQPGSGLDELHAVRLNAEDIARGADTAGASALGANALVMEMKATDGLLTWASGTALAADYGVNGGVVLSELLPALREQGYYLVAELSCCLDSLMARRNPPLALQTAAGAPYEDARGGWLDPYNLSVRTYLLDLMDELAQAGFDEVLLTGLSFPENAGAVAYSQPLLGTSTPRNAVSGLAVYLAQNAPDGLRVSALLESTALRGTGEAETESVQDAALFCRVFDRLYCLTSAEYLATDSAALRTAAAGAELGARFVPMLSAAPDTGSWVVTAG